jgi:hypothetical protein
MLTAPPYRTMLLSMLVCAVSPCATAISAQHSPEPGQLKILYTENAGFSQNEVPGIPGATFYIGGGLNRVRVSPSGTIGVQAIISLNGQLLDALLVNDRVVLKEGDPLPWAPTETLALIRDFDVNDSGAIAVSLSSTGPNSSNRYCVREDAPGTWTVIAQQGNPIPDFPGKNYGTQYGATIDNGNRVGFGFGGHADCEQKKGPPDFASGGPFEVSCSVKQTAQDPSADLWVRVF